VINLHQVFILFICNLSFSKEIENRLVDFSSDMIKKRGSLELSGLFDKLFVQFACSATRSVLNYCFYLPQNSFNFKKY